MVNCLTKKLDKKMRYKIKLILVPVLLLFLACEEYTHSPITEADVKPSKVENVVITPIPGGFDITYDLPSNNDLLYVKAVYKLTNGEDADVKSSIFKNKIQILGFGDTNEKSISLYSVNRAELSSDPVVLNASPLTPPVFIIQNTLKITEDFAGAKFVWTNDSNTPISIELLAENEQGELAVVNTQYTEQTTGKVSIRGYEPKPTLFAAIIRDRYDNFSDTIYAETPDKLLTPLKETRLDKSLFVNQNLDNDTYWSAWGSNFYNLFDDDNDSFAHTQGDSPRPDIMTIDLGVNVQLSRFTVYQRGSNTPHFAYTHGNPKSYTVYGSKELPSQDGSIDNWILLRDCMSIKPSGLPLGQNTNEDMEHFYNGDEYTFEEQVEIRYFRIYIHETWDGAGYTDFSEITFWGNINE
jgi:hypothetical protein